MPPAPASIAPREPSRLAQSCAQPPPGPAPTRPRGGYQTSEARRGGATGSHSSLPRTGKRVPLEPLKEVPSTSLDPLNSGGLEASQTPLADSAAAIARESRAFADGAMSAREPREARSFPDGALSAREPREVRKHDVRDP